MTSRISGRSSTTRSRANEPARLGHLALDLRTTHAGGVRRYGVSIARELVPLVREMGLRVSLIVDDVDGWDGNGLERSDLLLTTGCGRFLRDDPAVRDWLLTEGVDVLYTPHYLVDAACPVPFIVTVHDLLRVKDPAQGYSDREFAARFGASELARMRLALSSIDPDASRRTPQTSIFAAYLRAATQHIVRSAAHVATVSEAVASDIVGFLGTPPARVTVIPGAASPTTFYPRTGREIEAARAKFALPKSYCLHVGLGKSHKRIPWLVEAFCGAAREIPGDVGLVLVGDFRPFGETRAAIDRCADARSVRQLGVVGDNDLARLYSGCRALVVSSLDEGYCLPVDEARRCGAPVIATRLPSIVERAVDDAGIALYGVDDQAGLRACIREAFLRERDAAPAAWLATRSWRRSAEQVLEVALRAGSFRSGDGSPCRASVSAASPLGSLS